MSGTRQNEYFCGLVKELSKLPVEAEWAEFKHNNANPETIGANISAVSNSAALLGREHMPANVRFIERIYGNRCTG